MVEGCSPFSQNPVGLFAFSGETFGSGEELTLDGKCVAESAVEHFNIPVVLFVAGDVSDGKERVREENGCVDESSFAHSDGEEGGSDLEGVGVFVLVGFAEQDMEASHAVLGVHSLPFGVDEGSVETDAGSDGFENVVGPLRELELDGRVRHDSVNVADPDVIDRVFVHLLGGWGFAGVEDVTADSPDSGENLSSDEEWDQEVDVAVHQFVLGLDEVVFVAAKGVTTKVINGVVVDRNRVLELEVFYGLDDESLSGTVVGDEIFEALTFGGSVFEVRADRVDVEPGAIAEESAALGRLEYIVTSMVVDGSDFAFEEEVVLDGFDDVFGSTEVFVHDEATELGLDSKYALV